MQNSPTDEMLRTDSFLVGMLVGVLTSVVVILMFGTMYG